MREMECKDLFIQEGKLNKISDVEDMFGLLIEFIVSLQD
jgi:hypothetical protein